jgi:hypothetical protein
MRVWFEENRSDIKGIQNTYAAVLCRLLVKEKPEAICNIATLVERSLILVWDELFGVLKLIGAPREDNPKQNANRLYLLAWYRGFEQAYKKIDFKNVVLEDLNALFILACKKAGNKNKTSQEQAASAKQGVSKLAETYVEAKFILAVLEPCQEKKEQILTECFERKFRENPEEKYMLAAILKGLGGEEANLNNLVSKDRLNCFDELRQTLSFYFKQYHGVLDKLRSSVFTASKMQYYSNGTGGAEGRKRRKLNNGKTALRN